LIAKEVPETLKECKDIEKDLGRLLQLAEVIEHPLSLMFRAGKNFLINGVDIFKRFNLAMQAIRNADYFNFGIYLGEALDEVVLKSPAKKKLRDEQGYEFLCGYMDGLLHLPLERVNIYNRMDNMGSLIMSPLIKIFKSFESDSALVSLGALSDRVWMGLHEFQHAFTDSGNALVRKKAITQP
jgi:hypothetical protein